MSRWTALVSGEIRPGVYRLPPRTRADAARRAAESYGWRVFELDGAGISDKPSFLKAAGKAMRFPKYYGQNWDAFEEMVNDLEWAPASGYLLLYLHADRFASSPDWATALAILNKAAANWLERQTPFFCLIGGAADGLPELPAGEQ